MNESTPRREGKQQISNPVIQEGQSYKWKFLGEKSFISFSSNARGSYELVKWAPAENSGVHFLRKETPTVHEAARFCAAFRRDFGEITQVAMAKNIFLDMIDREEYVYEVVKRSFANQNIYINEGNWD